MVPRLIALLVIHFVIGFTCILFVVLLLSEFVFNLDVVVQLFRGGLDLLC